MEKLLSLLGAGALALALAAPAAASNAGGGNAPGQNAEVVIALYDDTGSPGADGDGTVDNLGGAISGGYYGNTSNAGTDSDAPDDNNGVTPSSSPGPVIGGCTQHAGASLGFIITGNGPSAVPQGNIPDRC